MKKQMYCEYCESEIKECDSCGMKFLDGDNIYCFNNGDDHYCEGCIEESLAVTEIIRVD